MIAMVLMVKALLLRLDLCVFSYLVEPHLLVNLQGILLLECRWDAPLGDSSFRCIKETVPLNPLARHAEASGGSFTGNSRIVRRANEGGKLLGITCPA